MYWGYARYSGQQCSGTASLVMQRRHSNSSLSGNAGSWVPVLTLSPYFSQAELNESVFVLFSFLTSTFSRSEHRAWSDNECLHATVFPNCSIVPSNQWWSPDPSQDKNATAEEGKVSCLTKAVLFKPKMELTTHSNRCTQNTKADCLALPYIILWNPSDPYLIKQDEMIP